MTKKGNGTLRLMKRNTTFFPQLKEEKTPQHVQQELTPSTSTTHEDTLPSPKSERVVSRTRTVQDLYDQTERLDNITLFCLFADCEPVDFEEVVQDKRRRDAMDKENNPSRRRTHGNSSPFQKGTRLSVSSECIKQRRMSREKLKDTRQG